MPLETHQAHFKMDKWADSKVSIGLPGKYFHYKKIKPTDNPTVYSIKRNYNYFFPSWLQTVSQADQNLIQEVNSNST